MRVAGLWEVRRRYLLPFIYDDDVFVVVVVVVVVGSGREKKNGKKRKMKIPYVSYMSHLMGSSFSLLSSSFFVLRASGGVTIPFSYLTGSSFSLLSHHWRWLVERKLSEFLGRKEAPLFAERRIIYELWAADASSTATDRDESSSSSSQHPLSFIIIIIDPRRQRCLTIPYVNKYGTIPYIESVSSRAGCCGDLVMRWRPPPVLVVRYLKVYVPYLPYLSTSLLLPLLLLLFVRSWKMVKV